LRNFPGDLINGTFAENNFSRILKYEIKHFTPLYFLVHRPQLIITVTVCGLQTEAGVTIETTASDVNKIMTAKHKVRLCSATGGRRLMHSTACCLFLLQA
jgi:hypothetical protein